MSPASMHHKTQNVPNTNRRDDLHAGDPAQSKYFPQSQQEDHNIDPSPDLAVLGRTLNIRRECLLFEGLGDTPGDNELVPQANYPSPNPGMFERTNPSQKEDNTHNKSSSKLNVNPAITNTYSQEELEVRDANRGMNDHLCSSTTELPPTPDRLSATNLEAHNHIYEATRANKQSVEARKFLFENPDNFSPDKRRDHFNAFVNMSKERLNRTDLLRNIHRRNLYYLKVTFPDDEIEVDKENYAFLLMGYRFFNKEKFLELPLEITFGAILDTLKVPTSDINFDVNKDTFSPISRILRAHYALARQELVEYLGARSIETSAEILRLYDECTRV